MASRNIKDLHPDFQGMVTELLRRGSEVVEPYIFFITDGYRSMEEQQALYASGRTKTGKILTMAKPGQSAHNYGLAVDLAFQKDGRLIYDDALYQKVYPIARSLGFVLGADWTTFRDRPHFEFPDWHNKVNQKPAPLPSTSPGVTPAHRNILVTHAIGLNTRLEPNTTSKIVNKLPKGTSVTVTGWVTGENVAGIDKWWLSSEGTYLWSGATNVVPSNQPTPTVAPSVPMEKIIEDAPAANPITTTPPADVNQIVSELREELKARDQVIAEQITIIDQKTQAMVSLQTASQNIVAIKNANEGLVAQLETRDAQLTLYKEKLRVAYAQAFAGWELIEVPQGASFIGLGIPTILKVVKLLLDVGKNKYVLGWKRGAQLYQTNPQPEVPDITAEAIEAGVNTK